MSEINSHIKERAFGYLLLLVAILSALLLRTCNKASDAQSNADAYRAANDTLHKTIDERGREVTETRLMLVDYNSIKHELHTADSTVRKLQALVDKNTIGATVLNTTTHDAGTTHTTVSNSTIVTRHDTVFVYPTYSTTWAERWSNGSITANKDSVHRDVRMINEYDIKQSYQRNGDGLSSYFRQRVPVVQVTNLNPFTTTPALIRVTNTISLRLASPFTSTVAKNTKLHHIMLKK